MDLSPMFAPLDTSKDVGDRTLYLVPEANWEKFEREMTKLSRRSVRLIGSEITPVVFGRQVVNRNTTTEYVALEVFLSADTPVIDGWTFVARLDHSPDTGNIIRAVPNLTCEIPTEYRECPPKCDHCKVNRRRRDTFLLWNQEDDSFKEVGSSCLTDFFGHDPHKIARLAEYLGYADEIAKASQEYDPEDRSTSPNWTHVESFLAYSALAIREYGWVSGSAAYQDSSLTSTKTTAHQLYVYGGKTPSAEDHKVAGEALQWARDLSGDLNDYLHNLNMVALSSYCESRSLGLVASIVSAYQRSVAKAKADAIPESNVFIGEVSKKIRGRAILSRIITYDNSFGLRIYVFKSENTGAVLKWTTSTDNGMKVGDTVTISGTVKAHEVYRGVNQTVLTRCKVEQ